jgi:hypothetical protein
LFCFVLSNAYTVFACQDARLDLSESNWDTIFEKCGTVLRLKKDEIVIEEGQSHARIFHIVRGRVRVETEGKFFFFFFFPF